jgi:hypothetical protein
MGDGGGGTIDIDMNLDWNTDLLLLLGKLICRHLWELLRALLFRHDITSLICNHFPTMHFCLLIILGYCCRVRSPVGAYEKTFVGRDQPLKWISVILRGLVFAVACGVYIWFTKKKIKVLLNGVSGTFFEDST